MDFNWPQEYLDFKNKLIEFAKSELNEHTLERDESQTFSLELWKKCINQLMV